MYYLIKETLEPVSREECLKHEFPYVAVVSDREFNENPAFFDMGIDMGIDSEHPETTKVVVNYDSLTGTLNLFDRTNVFGPTGKCAFALDEKGIVFINDDGTAQKLIDKIMMTRKWRTPSLERFIYDFLEQIVSGDLRLFEQYDKRLDELEDRILAGETKDILRTIIDLRGEILEIHTHYEQMLDLSQELQENENNFFDPDNLRYFDMYTNRLMRLSNLIAALRERVIQVRDLYDTQLDIRQNKVSTILTIVATIFMPLTLIAGWYGMNFKYMPELDKPWGYPLVIVISLLIVIVSVIYFKRKKWF